MSDGSSDLLLELSKLFREHVQTVLNLAAGSFVISVTFLQGQGPHLQGKTFLTRSWILMVAAMFFGLAYNYVLTVYVRAEGKRFGSFLSTLSLIFHGTFVVAMYYLLRFGMANVN